MKRYRIATMVFLMQFSLSVSAAPIDSEWLVFTHEAMIQASSIRINHKTRTLQIQGKDGQNKTIPVENCVALLKKARPFKINPLKKGSTLVVELVSGERILGTTKHIVMKEDQLTIQSGFWGEISFPREQLQRILFVPETDLAIPDPEFTGVYLKNGDEVSGKIMSITGETVVVNFEDVGKIPVAGFSTLDQVVFKAKPPLPKTVSGSPQKKIEILLRNTEIILADTESFKSVDNDSWSVNVSWKKEPIIIPLDLCLSAVFRGNRFFLSDFQPSRIKLIPFFDYQLGWQRDRALDLGPLNLGAYQAKKGFALHTHTELVFDISQTKHDKPFSFCGLLGLDTVTSPRGGAVEFILQADGKEIFRKSLQSGMPPQPCFVDIPGDARQIKLTAGFGKYGSVADHLNIMWSALVPRHERKKAPTEQIVPQSEKENVPADQITPPPKEKKIPVEQKISQPNKEDIPTDKIEK